MMQPAAGACKAVMEGRSCFDSLLMIDDVVESLNSPAMIDGSFVKS